MTPRDYTFWCNTQIDSGNLADIDYSPCNKAHHLIIVAGCRPRIRIGSAPKRNDHSAFTE